MKRSEALKIRANLETAVQSLPDESALKVRTFYPKFKELCEISYKAEEIGFRFQYGDKLYKTKQPGYIFVSHYPPGVGKESLYEVIDETHEGTLDDPIPYSGNMELEQGKYYVQDGEKYRCTRDTGIPVYAPLADLVGVYVEIV